MLLSKNGNPTVPVDTLLEIIKKQEKVIADLRLTVDILLESQRAKTFCGVCGLDQTKKPLLVCTRCDAKASHVECFGITRTKNGEQLCKECLEDGLEAARDE